MCVPCARAPEGPCLVLSFAVGAPPAPGFLWLASRVPSYGRRGVQGAFVFRGCPRCPRPQQCRTTRCVKAHVEHGGFPCCSHIHGFINWHQVSGRRALLCGGMKIYPEATSRVPLVFTTMKLEPRRLLGSIAGFA